MCFSIGVISRKTKIEGIRFGPFHESITLGDSVHIDVFIGRACERITLVSLFYIYKHFHEIAISK